MENDLELIRETISTNQIKKYLPHFGSGKLSSEVITSALKKLAISSNYLEEIDLIHLQIFMFIEDEEVTKLKENFMEYLAPVTPRTVNGGITNEYYLQLVFQLNLHEQFIHMVVASEGNELAKRLIAAAIPILMHAFNAETADAIPKEIITSYLVFLAYLCCGDKENTYFLTFRDILMNFMDKVDTSIIGRSEKTLLIFKIIGVICQEDDDIIGRSEISELLNKQTEFKKAFDMSQNKTFRIFKALFGRENGKDSASCSGKVLNILEQVCGTMIQNECVVWPHKTEELKEDLLLLSIGECANISNLMLQRYNSKLNLSYKNLEGFINLWLQFKPKERFADFQESIMTFDEFCKLILVHGKNPSYSQEWRIEFLKYPDACRSPQGLKVIENVIGSTVDLQTGLSLIQELETAMVTHEDLKEKIKDVILNIATNEPITSSEESKNELVKQVYREGVHCKFTKFNFGEELNNLLTKMGALEFDPTTKYLGGSQVSTLTKEKIEYCNTTFQLYFENPVECAFKMVPLALRTRKFQTLHYVKEFLSLKTVYEDPTEDRLYSFSESPNLLEYTLFHLLISTDRSDSLWDIFEKNVCLLINEGFLSSDQLRTIVEHAANLTFCKNNLANWIKILKVYFNLFRFEMEGRKENAHKFMPFTQRTILCATFHLASKTHALCIEAREKSLEILTLAQDNGIFKFENFELPIFNLEEVTLQSLGVAYIGYPGGRESILAYLGSHVSLLSGLNENIFTIYMLNWVTNFCSRDWDNLLAFVQHLLEIKTFKTDCHISLNSLVNDTIFLSTKQCNVRVTHYLSFFKHYLRGQQTKNTAAYKEMYLEHKNVVKTLTAIVRRLHNPKAKAPVPINQRDQYLSNLLNDVLLYLLEYTEWIILNSTHFEKIQESCVKLVSMTEPAVKAVGQNTALTFFFTIFTKLENGKDNLSTFERNVSNIVDSCENGVQIQVSKNSNPEILKNYAMLYQQDERDIYEALEQTQLDRIEEKDLFPFQDNRNETSAMLNVELKFV